MGSDRAWGAGCDVEDVLGGAKLYLGCSQIVQNEIAGTGVADPRGSDPANNRSQWRQRLSITFGELFRRTLLASVTVSLISRRSVFRRRTRSSSNHAAHMAQKAFWGNLSKSQVLELSRGLWEYMM